MEAGPNVSFTQCKIKDQDSFKIITSHCNNTCNNTCLDLQEMEAGPNVSFTPEVSLQTMVIVSLTDRVPAIAPQHAKMQFLSRLLLSRGVVGHYGTSHSSQPQ